MDNWYDNNLKNYPDQISIEAGFCGDRTSYSGNGIGTAATDYTVYNRLIMNKLPILKCSNNNDLYTISLSSKGNKVLTNPIGLITADEVSMAGGVYGQTNQSYYLYNNQYYWTMSPFFFDGFAVVFGVFSNGSLIDANVSNSTPSVRPVINIANNVTIKSGDGTSDNPYIVI